jgi:hypothetical protein
MADEKKEQPKFTPPDLATLRDESQGIFESLNDISKLINESTKNLSKETQESAGGMNAAFQDSVKLSGQLRSFTAADLKDRNATRKMATMVAKAEKNIVALKTQQKSLTRRAAVATGEEKERLKGIVELQEEAVSSIQAQIDATKGLSKELQNIDKSVSFFDNMSEFTKQIPGLNKVLPEFANAAKAARDAGGGAKGLAAGGKQLVGVFGKAALAFGINKIVEGVKLGQTRVTEFSRSLNISREAAQKLNNQFVDGAGVNFSADQLIEYQKSTNSALGASVKFNKENAIAFATMQQRLGLSTEEATKLTFLASATGKSVTQQNEAIVAQVQAMNVNNKTGIKYQQVMKDISEAGSATALTIGKFPGGMAKAAFNARKLGLTLAQVSKISENNLDFESSISNEMEAELLLGKDLRLDKLRLAAMNGNQADVAAEIARITKEAGDFSEMNVYQQQALAKAMGMSREELADSIVKEKALKDLGVDKGKDMTTQLKAKIATALAIKDETERAKALAKIEAVKGGTELLRQQENLSLQEKQALAQQKMTDSMTKFATALDPIGKVFTWMSEHAQEIVIALTALGGLSMFGKFRNLAKSFKSLTSGARKMMSVLKGGGKVAAAGAKGGGAVMKASGKMVYGAAAKSAVKAGSASVAKTGMKIGAKAVGKSLLKKIPIIGALAGVGFALSRAAKGDYAGAALELASGAASIIPGFGTAASVAIDAGLAARDISQSKSRSADTMEVDDFTIKSNPKDTITMAGGTKLGGNVEALLEELISLVKSGGNVYLDGSKVGEALVLSSRLST